MLHTVSMKQLMEKELVFKCTIWLDCLEEKLKLQLVMLD